MKNPKKAQTSFKELMPAVPFVLPLVLLLGVMVVLPVLGTCFNSFFSDTGFSTKKWIGVGNYTALLGDTGFWQSLRFTVLFVLASVPMEIALGIAFALLMNAESPGRSLLRACVLIPWAIPTAISSRTWELIYSYQYGLANYLISLCGFSNAPINWLGTSYGAFFSLVITEVWKTTPFVAIIVLAGLQSISHDLYAQARIDRANFWQIFMRITLPLVKPAILVALLFRTIDALRVFDVVYVLTRGGPGGATNSLSLYAYKYFLNGDFGHGSAVSAMLFLLALGLSILYIKAGGLKKASA